MERVGLRPDPVGYSGVRGVPGVSLPTPSEAMGVAWRFKGQTEFPGVGPSIAPRISVWDACPVFLGQAGQTLHVNAAFFSLWLWAEIPESHSDKWPNEFGPLTVCARKSMSRRGVWVIATDVDASHGVRSAQHLPLGLWAFGPMPRPCGAKRTLPPSSQSLVE